MKTNDRLTPAILLATVLAAAGCSKDNTVNMNGGAAGAGPSELGELPDCATDAPAPGTAGPEMVRVGRLDGSCFWIDLTEVSRADYDTFKAAHPDEPAQSTPCSANESFDPDASCVSEPSVTDSPDHPVVCVDWCDAKAFCEWAGKTLCRGEYGAPKNAKTNSWYSACSHGGQTYYPYSKVYDEGLCNGAEAGVATTVPVTSKASCKTGDGVLNLSGNVAEWVDECKDASGGDDSCRVRGGSYKSDAQSLMCETALSPARSTRQVDIGFRCCAYD